MATAENIGTNTRPAVLWEGITQSDTCDEFFLPGGDYIAEVTGDFSGSAVIQLEWGSQSGTTTAYDTDEAPDGAKFSAAGVVKIRIADGYHKPTITGGDGSTDVDVRIKPIYYKGI